MNFSSFSLNFVPKFNLVFRRVDERLSLVTAATKNDGWWKNRGDFCFSYFLFIIYSGRENNIYFVERLKRKTFPNKQNSLLQSFLSTTNCSFLRFNSKWIIFIFPSDFLLFWFHALSSFNCLPSIKLFAKLHWNTTLCSQALLEMVPLTSKL